MVRRPTAKAEAACGFCLPAGDMPQAKEDVSQDANVEWKFVVFSFSFASISRGSFNEGPLSYTSAAGIQQFLRKHFVIC